MSQYTPEEFDRLVKELRPTSPPRGTKKRKFECTPEEWACHLQHVRKYYHQNNEYKKAFPHKNRENVRRWRKRNPDKKREQVRKWSAANPDKVRATRRRCEAARLLRDPSCRIKKNLRSRLCEAVRTSVKSGSSVRDLGMTIAGFKSHIESQFQDGWSWDNWGSVWELDHIYPLRAADIAASRPEFLAVNNWRNFQPLSVEDNRRKHDTITPEAQALFDQLVAEFTVQTEQPV